MGQTCKAAGCVLFLSAGTQDKIGSPISLVTFFCLCGAGGTLLSVTYRPDPGLIYALLNQKLFDAIRAAITQSNVVVLATTVIAMSLNRESDVTACF
jgi:hypothetical protein